MIGSTFSSTRRATAACTMRSSSLSDWRISKRSSGSSVRVERLVTGVSSAGRSHEDHNLANRASGLDLAVSVGNPLERYTLTDRRSQQPGVYQLRNAGEDL